MTDRAITPEQLATLSHEFRTPLNGVLGMARLLDGTSLTAEQRAYVAALKESGDHLLSLINDVLDLARLVCEVVGFTGEIRTDPSKPDGTMRKLMSGETLKAMGWAPRVGLEKGVAGVYSNFARTP